jgi:ATP-dependent Clp endopeptidase proteolytic subunit ClpP
VKTTKINIKGVIVPNDYKEVYEWLGMEAVSPKEILDQLNQAKKGEIIEVEINSGGGSVYAGSEIYTALMEYKGDVIVSIVGIAASAASVIAMAGTTTKISPTAQIMIHNVSSGVIGDYRDLQHEAEVIKNYNVSIANAYVLKTGLSQDELLKLMDAETWLNAQQAKEKGFVDEVMFDSGMQLVAGGALLPQEVIQKVKNQIKDNQKKKLFQAKLNLLKLEERK